MKLHPVKFGPSLIFLNDMEYRSHERAGYLRPEEICPRLLALEHVNAPVGEACIDEHCAYCSFHRLRGGADLSFGDIFDDDEEE